ncbi:DinB family protein [Deinococcus navajonensis]|uniref:DinB family protein n=1 Tax=Deinococcus navajonensis TaxID=309884 RepID=A0ABV8XSW8_9DEIO
MSVETVNPKTREELLRDLMVARDAVSDLVRGLSLAQFTGGSASQWSVSHHLDHLCRSNAPVAAGMSVPERLPQAPGARPSRTFASLQADYQARLSEGVKATGRFVPEPGGDLADQLAEYQGGLEVLVERVQAWPETDLDVLAMPHPALGLLTVREMLYFTLAHNLHHLRGMQARLEHP